LITDISSFDQSFRFTVYPNPSSGIVNLSGDILASGNFTVEVYDNVGRLVFTAANEMILDLSGLDNGIYSLFIRTEGAERISKQICIAK
jgi:hypothetical protein